MGKKPPIGAAKISRRAELARAIALIGERAGRAGVPPRFRRLRDSGALAAVRVEIQTAHRATLPWRGKA
jgi:hypothetical protein